MASPVLHYIQQIFEVSDVAVMEAKGMDAVIRQVHERHIKHLQKYLSWVHMPSRRKVRIHDSRYL